MDTYARADIVKFAEENRYNHIIVGSRGMSGISRVLLGSVAEGIVEKAHCIVTVVRTAPFIKKGGEWIDFTEIENLLIENESVGEVAVTGTPDEELGEKIVAFIVPAEGYEPAEGEIKDYMKQFVEDNKIEEYEVPDEVKFLKKMPKTSVGKIDREVLKAKYT